MKVQFGKKLEPSSSLGHMFKSALFLLTIKSAVLRWPHCSWTCYSASVAALELQETFPLFILLNQHWERRCHLHLVEKLFPNMKQKVPLKVSLNHVAGHPPGETHLPWGLKTQKVKLPQERFQVRWKNITFCLFFSPDSSDFITLFPMP